MKNIPKIYPVIHFLDEDTALLEANIVHRTGADGLFLIAHGNRNDDNILPNLAGSIKQIYPNLFVGVNLLSKDPVTAVKMAMDSGLDGVWCDNAAVDSDGERPDCIKIKEMLVERDIKVREFYQDSENLNNNEINELKKSDKFEVFASVAFKYQKFESNPEGATVNAIKAGFVPTTSGAGTGKAPDIDKISKMSAVSMMCDSGRPNLAIASGMTVENVQQFAPYLSYILVATGVALDDWHIDEKKLVEFIKNVRA